jgi:hypothetical protein
LRKPAKDPITIAARAAAERLEAEPRPGLIAKVETVLIARKSPSAAPRYLTPTGLASLIVSVVSLAWTVHADLKKRTDKRVRRTFTYKLRHRSGRVRSRCLFTVIGTVFTVRSTILFFSIVHRCPRR